MHVQVCSLEYPLHEFFYLLTLLVLPIVIVVLFLGPAHDQYLNKIVNENGTEISAM